MFDVVVIGAGNSGTQAARQCADNGFCVALVGEHDQDISSIAPSVLPETIEPPLPGSAGIPAGTLEFIRGRGVAAGAGMAAVLDPATGDERRMLPCRAIVLAVGCEGKGEARVPRTQLLGITKLGAQINGETGKLFTDANGMTSTLGIFAAGSCGVSAVSPAAVAEGVIKWLSSNLLQVAR